MLTPSEWNSLTSRASGLCLRLSRDQLTRARLLLALRATSAIMAIVSGSCARVNGSRNGPSVSSATPGSAGQSQPMIAVWEWQDDVGCWRPYSGQVSAHIERCLSPRGHRGGGGPGSTSICLGQSDPSLSPYLIDIPSLKQFRQDTGELIQLQPRCILWITSAHSSRFNRPDFWLLH